LCNAPSCAYYEQQFDQKYRAEQKEDRNHAHLQSANKKSDCEIIERGTKSLLRKMLFLSTDQSSGILRELLIFLDLSMGLMYMKEFATE